MKNKIEQLQHIKDPFEFKDSVNEILYNHVYNAEDKVAKIGEFRTYLYNLVSAIEDNDSKNKILTENYTIWCSDFTYIYPLMDAVTFAIQFVNNEEAHAKMFSDVSDFNIQSRINPEYFKKRKLDMFKALADGKLNEFTNIEHDLNTDKFDTVDSLINFLNNDVILDVLTKLEGIKVVYSDLYTYNCKIDSFPLLNTLFVTGSTASCSKEESLLNGLGILVYNRITAFGQGDLSHFGLGKKHYPMDGDTFAQVFSYYIMKKMGIDSKHRFFNNLWRFDTDLLMGDVNKVKKIIDDGIPLIL